MDGASIPASIAAAGLPAIDAHASSCTRLYRTPASRKEWPVSSLADRHSTPVRAPRARLHSKKLLQPAPERSSHASVAPTVPVRVGHLDPTHGGTAQARSSDESAIGIYAAAPDLSTPLFTSQRGCSMYYTYLHSRSRKYGEDRIWLFWLVVLLDASGDRPCPVITIAFLYVDGGAQQCA